MSLIATAFYQEDWFKAIIYIVIAVIIARVVDFVLARRDRAMARAARQDAGQGRPHPLRHDPAAGVRRHPLRRRRRSGC